MDKACEYEWPYLKPGPAYALFERGLAKAERVGGLALWLNGVPEGGRAEVEVGEVRALPARPVALEGLAVELNGVRHALPFALKGGEFAELADGFWTRYSMEAEPLERRASAGAQPTVAAGKNGVRLLGKTADGSAPRAEVTVMEIGSTFPAAKETLRDDQEKVLAYEAHMPEMWSPANGLDALAPLVVRKGMSARVEVELVGPVARPVLSIGGEKCAFDVDVGANEKLVMKDGRNWFVRGPCGKVRVRGSLGRPLPLFSGVNALSMASSDPDRAYAQVRIVKRYGNGRSE